MIEYQHTDRDWVATPELNVLDLYIISGKNGFIWKEELENSDKWVEVGTK